MSRVVIDDGDMKVDGKRKEMRKRNEQCVGGFFAASHPWLGMRDGISLPS
jgi:hypothetical protein